ncbi:MAG: methyltransferase domain-containing protein [Caldilineaceae bacterium]|nr:methyltransferase domain-containing protein [Caldilineaceae bacterium]
MTLHADTSRIAQQNKLIQQEFTKQAQAYASNPTVRDADWAMRLVQAASPSPNDRVLEVATGPGYVALAFAAAGCNVIGVDLTAAPLAIAEQNRQERSLTNVRFEAADANQLPFEDSSFDIVVCRLAVHHFAEPQTVFGQMARVCRPGGKVVIEDLLASENLARAEFYNRWEQLRDPSHVAALSLSQLIGFYAAAGFEVESVQSETRTQVVEQWLRNSQTPPDKADEVRQLLAADRAQNRSGIHIFEDDAGQLCFDHRMFTVVGRKA